jgi:hypothetical protein
MMRGHAKKARFILLFLFPWISSSGQQTPGHKVNFGSGAKDDALILFRDTVTNEYGYKTLKGEIIIPSGKYLACFTDTFRTYAIVFTSRKLFIAIDRHEQELYGIFRFDNGPDYTSEGLFRIVVGRKMGYADSATGKIVIKPQFACAWPFEQGVAKVSNDCRRQRHGEHSVWLSNSWYYIDKKGRRVKPPQFEAH